MRQRSNLNFRYPPSEPCACEICTGYCIRPGWWTVKEAALALDAGLGGRMMLEVSPDRSYGVLSPAFRGCEGSFALEIFKETGCNFLQNKKCELHGTPYQPLECRYCHHNRPGRGPVCHAALERDWRTHRGQALVLRWTKQFQLWELLPLFGLEKLLTFS
jgi:hypothetical protein